MDPRRRRGLPHLPAPVTPLRPTRLAVVDNAPESIGPNAGSATLNPSLRSSPVVFSALRRARRSPLVHRARPRLSGGRDIELPCAVHAETVLAMPDGNPSSQPGTAGGLFGTRSELARAILRAVDDWKGDVLSGNGAEPRLVINLSLGWEDHSADVKSTSNKNCNITRSGDLDSPSQAVYDAVVYARCHGALVLAASGNDTGGRLPSGTRASSALRASWCGTRRTTRTARSGSSWGLHPSRPTTKRRQASPAPERDRARLRSARAPHRRRGLQRRAPRAAPAGEPTPARRAGAPRLLVRE